MEDFMKTMNRVLLCGLFLLLGTGMIFAGGQNQAKKGLNIHYLSAHGPEGPVVLTLQDIAAEWKQTHPDFNFTVECIANRASYLQKVHILAASNELPEWFDADPEDFFEGLVDAGMIYDDIEGLYRELGVADRVNKIDIEYVRLPKSKKVALIGLECNYEYFWYNKEMFAKAGIRKAPETLDELLAACEALQKAGFIPISTTSMEWVSLRYIAMPAFRMAGNKYIMDAVQGKASFGIPVGIASAEYVQKLAKYFNPDFATSDYGVMMDLFNGNRAAMVYTGTWELPNMVDENFNLKENIGVFGMPKQSNRDVTPYTDCFTHAGIGVAIPKNKMTSEMKEYLAYVFKRYADIHIEKYRTLPPHSPSPGVKIPGFLAKVLSDVQAVNEYTRVWDVVIDQASLDTLMRTNTELLMGQKTPQQWAATMDAVVAENVKK
jgi:raffinose/stachyose/melibiose transport system substrate-binding protein